MWWEFIGIQRWFEASTIAIQADLSGIFMGFTVVLEVVSKWWICLVSCLHVLTRTTQENETHLFFLVSFPTCFFAVGFAGCPEFPWKHRWVWGWYFTELAGPLDPGKNPGFRHHLKQWSTWGTGKLERCRGELWWGCGNFRILRWRHCTMSSHIWLGYSLA